MLEMCYLNQRMNTLHNNRVFFTKVIVFIGAWNTQARRVLAYQPDARATPFFRFELL